MKDGWKRVGGVEEWRREKDVWNREKKKTGKKGACESGGARTTTKMRNMCA